MTEDTFHCGITLLNFKPHEFFCPCCQKEEMNKQTLLRIQRLRTDYGKPLTRIPGGGWRCAKYERDAASAHREGKAWDPGYPREDHFLMVKLAIEHGFRGIGDKSKGVKYQLHMDDALAIPGVRPRPWKWTYP